MTHILPERPAVLAETLADLADAPPAVQQSIGAGLVRSLRLVPRQQAPSWATDPDFIASVEAGFIELPDFDKEVAP